mgnify:CR=1 FL=1
MKVQAGAGAVIKANLMVAGSTSLVANIHLQTRDVQIFKFQKQNTDKLKTIKYIIKNSTGVGHLQLSLLILLV